MKLSTIARIFRKDAALGPRSPFVLVAITIPIAMTLVIQLVFGDLIEAKPRLALVDEGNSEITRAIGEIDGIVSTVLDDVDTLRRRVEAHDFDGGLVLPAGFDRAVRAGERPPLQIYISGESYAIDRMVLAVTAIDLIRDIEGRTAPVAVDVVDLGTGDPISLSTRLVPLIAMYAFIMAGLFVPASSLVEERERHTLHALLSTPATLPDVLAAKAVLGIVLTFIMTAITLALNRALGPDYGSMLGVLAITSVFWALLGLVVGLLARSSQALFAIVKGAGLFLFAPVVFYIFPDWPQWIARIIPTFWAIDPLWRIIAEGASLVDVAGSLAIVAGMCVLLLFVILRLSRRMLATMGSE